MGSGVRLIRLGCGATGGSSSPQPASVTARTPGRASLMGLAARSDGRPNRRTSGERGRREDSSGAAAEMADQSPGWR